ncbi:Response regulator of zinc sigma-54-dependent two-component system [Labilithrix luteola]|uniref:Response regulator of zinc sigma-54-dependent two-component system n=1 Tax=Labilithrix luteola TaxID=1391654 RepID=A0A0K1QFT8_9BACT|nr:sigma 54-interacting transcriptional regulator [Labilithrix luteola]AKV04641.1 Response regulator of zinc sigma-54-dependent two-component system [Labilithrix luteola]
MSGTGSPLRAPPSPAPARAHFAVMAAQPPRGASGISFYDLDRDVIRVGAAAEAELFLPDPELSGIYARIERREDGFVLVREQNPLLVNGMRVRIHLLSPFDIVVIGKNALSFRPGPVPHVAADAAGPSAGGSPPTIDAIRRLTAFAARAHGRENVAALAEQLVDDLMVLTGASRGTLVRLSSDEDPVSLVSSAHGSFSGGEVEISRTLLGKMRASGKSVHVQNTLTDPELAGAASLVGEPALSALCAPIVSEGRIVGAIYLSRRASRPLTQEARELVELYASHAVNILEGERRRALMEDRLGILGEAQDDESLIIGDAEPMVVLKKTLRKAAASRAPVLVTGETGTGKELVARELHRLSPRARGPFIAVNCGAIPNELLASELFGHKKGAFTGAAADRLGFFRSAEGGTLFLDEVGEMPLAQQVALLRVLQEERVVPVGAEESVSVDVRVVCATNRHLADEVQAGRFRQDLYFRLAIVGVQLPPLRERPGDVLRLAAHFLHKFTHERAPKSEGRSSQPLRFGDDALIAMRRARWEGNVRELEACVRRAVLMAEGTTLSAADLGLTTPTDSVLPRGAPLVRPLSMVRDEFLRQYVREVVARFGGNRTAAADALMVSARTVFKYVDE